MIHTIPSNADPVDGTVNADGAVWGEGRWHLVTVTSPSPIHSLLWAQAGCSCKWRGVQRWTRLAAIEAAGDGDRHKWSVSR